MDKSRIKIGVLELGFWLKGRRFTKKGALLKSITINYNIIYFALITFSDAYFAMTMTMTSNMVMHLLLYVS